MKHRKEIITTAGTLACAIGIGFFMQNGQAPVAASVEHSAVALADANAAVLDLEEIVLTSAELSDSAVTARPEEAVTLATAQEITAPDGGDTSAMAPRTILEQSAGSLKAQDASQTTCEVSAHARPVAAAMVNVALSAPCLPDERVTVQHSGLLFTQITDAVGMFEITVPALSREAVFVVAFTNGEGAVVQTTVEEIDNFDRVALQWKGETGFQLHAREFGADYNSNGHIWSANPRDMTYGVTGKGGYLSVMGDATVPDGLLAEVYTFPPLTAQRYGDVVLTVETEVGTGNCGLEIEAKTLQTGGGNDITTRNLTVSVPACDAVGSFLVLNNLFEDLKVASR